MAGNKMGTYKEMWLIQSRISIDFFGFEKRIKIT